jgi:hypothetical protein
MKQNEAPEVTLVDQITNNSHLNTLSGRGRRNVIFMVKILSAKNIFTTAARGKETSPSPHPGMTFSCLKNYQNVKKKSSNSLSDSIMKTFIVRKSNK